MEVYDFEVLRGDELIASARSIAISEPRAAWPKVLELAANVGDAGCRILVRNQAREAVISIGVNAAREMAGNIRDTAA